MSLFVLPDIVKLSKPIDRKIGGAGITRLLTKSDLMIQEPYVSQLWSKGLLSLLSLLELPALPESDGPDELYTLDIEEAGYQTTFAKLATSNPVPEDPTAGLPENSIFFAQHIMAMPTEKRSIVKSLLTQSPEANQFLPKYFENANISLNQL
jgi:exportin-2 (importin alpha re-exporter)